MLEALNHFCLREIANLPAHFLSAGQRRRVGLARLLAAPGRLWLLDEPAVGLDEDSVSALLDAIRKHRAVGGLVVGASHGELPLENAQNLTLPEIHS